MKQYRHYDWYGRVRPYWRVPQERAFVFWVQDRLEDAWMVLPKWVRADWDVLLVAVFLLAMTAGIFTLPHAGLPRDIPHGERNGE
jgi:hypothetical protein